MGQGQGTSTLKKVRVNLRYNDRRYTTIESISNYTGEKVEDIEEGIQKIKWGVGKSTKYTDINYYLEMRLKFYDRYGMGILSKWEDPEFYIGGKVYPSMRQYLIDNGLRGNRAYKVFKKLYNEDDETRKGKRIIEYLIEEDKYDILGYKSDNVGSRIDLEKVEEDYKRYISGKKGTKKETIII